MHKLIRIHSVVLLAITIPTRTHSSRMRTVRSSSRLCSQQGCLLPGTGAGPGGCLPWRGTCSGGICSQGGTWSGGVCSQGVPGLGVSQHALRQTPPVNRMTDRCKNITFATSLQTVIIHHKLFSGEGSLKLREGFVDFISLSPTHRVSVETEI